MQLSLLNLFINYPYHLAILSLRLSNNINIIEIAVYNLNVRAPVVKKEDKVLHSANKSLSSR